VFSISIEDTLTALDAASGQIVWQKTFPNPLKPLRPASITVTGTTRFSSSQIWVMPSLRPRIPLADMISPGVLSLHANAPPGEIPAERRSVVLRGSEPGTAQPAQTSVGELVK